MVAVFDNRPFYKTYSAVSGKPNGTTFDYSLESQTKSNQGPIPEGKYSIYPFEFWERKIYQALKDMVSWGNYRITLHPHLVRETHGRGGFFIHGGVSAGSIGCIDLTNEIDKFYEDLKKVIGRKTTCQIQLLVEYKGDKK